MPYKDYQDRLQRSREYYEEHKEEHRERRRLSGLKYSREHREERQEYNHKYREEHKEELQKSKHDYYVKNKDKARNQKYRRRAREMNQLGNFAPWMERYYKVVQQDQCYYCGCDISQEYNLEHQTPYVRGGLHDWSNTCLSCPPCNKSKGTKTAEEFMNT